MTKSLLTNRKFYNKWVYKISLCIPGISIIRSRSHSEVEAICSLNKIYNGITPYSIKKAILNKNEILKINDFIFNLKAEHGKRIEGDYIDFYTNDSEIYNTILTTFSNVVKICYAPRNDLIEELNSNKYIICNKLPYNKYRYKVYILPHKLKTSFLEKQKYISWIENQSKILVSEKTKKWFIKMEFNWDRRYMYVEDKNTLLLLQMRNPNVLGRIYEYMVIDK